VSGVIPFNKHAFIGRELEYVAQATQSGHLGGDGPFAKRCQSLLECELKAGKVLLTSSCTHALEMAALLLDIQPGDEVIVPSFTFVSTANAFVLRGAKPVLADIRSDTLNIDESQLERLITPRTKAITVMHYAGVGCEMDAINGIAASHEIPVVEDAAQSLFARYHRQSLGTFGALAAFSFDSGKNFTCGEGGMLIVNDEQYVERAEIIREKGTDRNRFFRGEVDKYTWADVGSNYLLSDIAAAYLYAQLEMREHIQAQRRQIFERYADSLREWAAVCGVKLPATPPHCEHNAHQFHLLLPSLARRNALITYLKSRSVTSLFHYLPLHLSPMGATWGYKRGDCPVAEDVSDRLIRLPFFTSMTEAEQARVIESVCQFAP